MTQIPSSQSETLIEAFHSLCIEINGGNPVLPPELIRNILVRLPVKSLIRFQCVCKEWKNLLKTQSFINEHLHHSTHQNPSLFLAAFSIPGPHRAYLLTNEMQVLDVHIDPSIDSIRMVHAINSCNGLICFGLGYFPGRISLSLWNPAKRRVRQVSQAVYYGMHEKFHVGFGFNSIVNDYKIVRIRESWAHARVTQVEVFSLNIGTWKEVEFGNLDGLVFDSEGLAFNGAIFWFGLKDPLNEDEYNNGIIVSFDVATEVFTLIPMPALPSSVSDISYIKHLTVYENKLALLSNTLSEDLKSSFIHLWVMEGTNASEERWCLTKKYASCIYRGCFLYPMTIWRNEIVCNVTHLARPVEQIEGEGEGEGEDEGGPNPRREIVMVNCTTNECRTFDISKVIFGYGIFNYAESLVSVSNIHIG